MGDLYTIQGIDTSYIYTNSCTSLGASFANAANISTVVPEYLRSSPLSYNWTVLTDNNLHINVKKHKLYINFNL